MLKRVLWGASLSLILGCNSIPPVPDHVQYGVHADIHPPGFYGVHNRTKERLYRPFEEPSMKGAQCVTLEDYKKLAEWAQKVKEVAERQCK